jgi:hypothetical protein
MSKDWLYVFLNKEIGLDCLILLSMVSQIFYEVNKNVWVL